MTISISEVKDLYSQYEQFKFSLTNAEDSLKKVIAAGTVIFNSATFAEAFPNTIAAYKTYLVNAQTAINNFVNNFPSEPQLDG